MIPETYSHILPFQEILELRGEQEEKLLQITSWNHHRELIRSFEESPLSECSSTFNGEPSLVSLAVNDDLQREYAPLVTELIKSLIPWRKGPFSFLGQEIDAEWRSDLKWDRIAPFLPEMRGRRIADIGANNGYYMFRMLAAAPELVAGFDPSSRCYYQFLLFQRVLRDPRLAFELFGIEHMNLFENFFDIVFCLGVIYHRRDPYTSCRMLFDALRKDGTLFLESLVYPGEEPLAFCPPGRYAKMRNVWYVPTVSCLMGWMEKAGFVEVEEISTAPVLVEEQRQTVHAPYESLKDFLDPNDSTRTIEGHPAPVRSIIRGRKQ
ncbi:tRNA 5-methoxyuridine(34)/uridine 5-oxyacetic acid(34) synthase CmoB [bacterium]|nr:tRNA 5-methoxyuridine(34)/uridine 5-oxyacetic acid(34) synthase CmoB [bacterium]